MISKLPRLKAYKRVYGTKLGRAYMADSRDFLHENAGKLKGSVDLIFTSPPFPLLRKKRYGNLEGLHYVRWLTDLGGIFRSMLSPKGSLVIELGNGWELGSPTTSTLPMIALLDLQRQNRFHLCQEVIWHNPARLPGPAQWVTVKRVRLKDSFTRFWWLSKTRWPKADNRRVLVPYSSTMKQLLRKGKYNHGNRPSEHKINAKSFLANNGGAIPPSVLIYSNTRSRDPYLDYCRSKAIPKHPARMPAEVARFFIKFLTEPGDLVLDPFAGSNTTGAVAESLNRRWIAIEQIRTYFEGSKGWFAERKGSNKSVSPRRQSTDTF